MKTIMRRSLSLLGIPLMMALSAAAQEEPKVKVNDHEYKYKSEDMKVKEQREESKLKATDLKVKENENERKVKGKVQPMRVSSVEQIHMKTGETQVRVKENIQPATTVETVIPAPTPALVGQAPVPEAPVVKKATPRKYAAAKRTTKKHVAARKTSAAPKYIVRTKVVRDTVYVPSPPERIVTTQTEYVRDTVLITRVDTVLRMETTNTYSGYRVPRGDFKKVKLKKDKDGEVWMKRKE